MRQRWAITSILLVAAATLFVPLPHGDLQDDGPMYAFVPLRALATGDFVRLYLDWDGEAAYFNKPPLQFWATAAVYRVAGVSVATARLTTALSWLAAAGLLYALARPRIGTLAAALAACLLLVQREVYKNVLEVRLDGGMVVGFLIASVGALLVAEDRRRWAWLLIGGGIGFGVVYRGPASLFGLLAITAFLLWQRRAALADWRGLLLMAAALVVTGGWWWAVQAAVHGGTFVDAITSDAVGQHLAAAAGDDLGKTGLNDGGGFLDPYYLQRLPEAYFLVLPLALLGGLVLRRDGLTPAARLSIVWLAVWLVVIHLTPVRVGRYTLPMAPWLCLLAAVGLTGFAAPRRLTARPLPFAAAAGFAVMLVLSLAGVELADSRDDALRAAAAAIIDAPRDPTRPPPSSPRVHVLADDAVLQKRTAVAFALRLRTLAAADLASIPTGDYLAVHDPAAQDLPALPLVELAGDARWRVYRVAGRGGPPRREGGEGP